MAKIVAVEVRVFFDYGFANREVRRTNRGENGDVQFVVKTWMVS